MTHTGPVVRLPLNVKIIRSFVFAIAVELDWIAAVSQLAATVTAELTQIQLLLHVTTM